MLEFIALNVYAIATIAGVLAIIGGLFIIGAMIVINKDIISLESINIFIGETQPTG